MLISVIEREERKKKRRRRKDLNDLKNKEKIKFSAPFFKPIMYCYLGVQLARINEKMCN